MASRDTGTGRDFELLADRALERGGYSHESQLRVGSRPGGGSHKVDKAIRRGDRARLVSFKWQQTAGTAEQKVPYEVICLMAAVDEGPWDKAYLVLGGDGWRLRDWYASGGLERYLAIRGRVEILNTDQFLSRANRGEL